MLYIFRKMTTKPTFLIKSSRFGDFNLTEVRSPESGTIGGFVGVTCSLTMILTNRSVFFVHHSAGTLRLSEHEIKVKSAVRCRNTDVLPLLLPKAVRPSDFKGHFGSLRCLNSCYQRRSSVTFECSNPHSWHNPR